MKPWRDMPSMSHAHVQRHNLAVLHFGAASTIDVGRQTFTLEVEPCRASYPLRLEAQAHGEPMTLDCDAQALFPELSRRSLKRARTRAYRLIAEAFDDWISAFEGAFGFAIEPSGAAFDVAPPPGALGFVLTHARSHRIAHFALDSTVIEEWLKRRPVPPPLHDSASLGGRLMVPVQMCMAGPTLRAQRVHSIKPGDALLLEPSSHYLRVPLRYGARRISLRPSGDYMMVDRPIIDDGALADTAGALVPASALTFSFDAVIATLSMSLDELTNLRSGATLPLQVPSNRHGVLLLCQGVPFARGELIDIDGALGVRLLDLASSAETPAP